MTAGRDGAGRTQEWCSRQARRLGWFLSDDDPLEPRYDPAHLAGTLIVCMAAAGGLYWLLWTLLVFEGGIFPKIAAASAVLLTGKTLRDYGYEGRPEAMGVFDGWTSNVAALLLSLLLLVALMRLYRAGAKPRP
ncbi:MAG: hypothetical protein HY748_05965 [Elusimicrobia bacterium]|nr:hypothetical protein [Elusimicrobiota bacterium]